MYIYLFNLFMLWPCIPIANLVRILYIIQNSLAFEDTLMFLIFPVNIYLKNSK